MTKKCPINWTPKDGPFPCAFKTGNGCTNEESSCIDIYRPRYVYAMTPTIVACFNCGKDVLITNGEKEKYSGSPIKCDWMCGKCTDEIIGLADHIAGRC